MTDIVQEIFWGGVVIAMALVGMPYFGLGALQYHVFRKKPSEKRISEFMKSLNPIIDGFYKRNYALLAWKLDMPAKISLYQYLVLYPSFTGLRLVYTMTLPIVAGFVLTIIPFWILLHAATYASGFTKLVSLIALVVLTLILARVLGFGSKI